MGCKKHLVDLIRIGILFELRGKAEKGLVQERENYSVSYLALDPIATEERCQFRQQINASISMGDVEAIGEFMNSRTDPKPQVQRYYKGTKTI